MKSVFADTHYWLAITRPRDQWKQRAKKARAALGRVRIVTCDEVLIEFLNGMSSGGPALRNVAVQIARKIMQDPNIHAIAQSRDSFLSALVRFEGRRDKGYSLTDCVAIDSMQARGIQEILTHDPHYRQEEFLPAYSE